MKLAKADRWLVEHIFEPVAREIETWVGANHWRVARFMILLWVAAEATWAIGKHSPMAYVISGLTLIVASLLALGSIALERMQGRGFANYLKHDSVQTYVRMLQTTNAALSLFSFSLSSVGSIALACANYFAACDRLPPKERRVFAMARKEAA